MSMSGNSSGVAAASCGAERQNQPCAKHKYIHTHNDNTASIAGLPVQIGCSSDLARGVNNLGPEEVMYQQSSMRMPNSPGM